MPFDGLGKMLVLLGLTWFIAYVPLGPFQTVAPLGIAGLKAALVAVFYMQLKRSSALLRLAAATGLFWLLLMFTLSFNDYLTRLQ